ncbi:uncharacterized protein BDV14DRAFT_203030 [Aspergillus stella-maris]|uniref:uncharacterized protein n=1 Tax=Aspergillus stella-maris TaxID=1810926 RepID=UPI003CCE2B4F
MPFSATANRPKATTTPSTESQSTQWYFGTRESSGVTVSSLGNRTFITLPNGFSIVATGGLVSFTEPPARDRSPQFRGYRDFRDGNTPGWNRRRRGRGGGQARNSSHSSGSGYMGGNSSGCSSYRPGPRGPIHANGHGNGNSNHIEQRARAELERQARNNRLQGRQQRNQGGAQGINVRSGNRNSVDVVVVNGLGDGISATRSGTGTATRTANAGISHSLGPTSASAPAFLPSTNTLVSGTGHPTTSTSLAISAQPQVQAHSYPPTTTPITNPFTQLMLNQYAPRQPSPPTTEEDEITILGSRPVSHRRQRQNQHQHQHQQESQNYTANQQDYVHSHHSGDDGKVEDEDEDFKIELDDLIGEAGLLDAGEEALVVGLGAGFMDLTDEL